MRRLSLVSQGVNQNEISGLSFAADGALWVASTQGELYRINLATLVPASAVSVEIAPATVTDTSATDNLALAYVQQSWVSDFVSGSAVTVAATNQDEELVIALPV